MTQGFKPDTKGIVVYGFDILTRAQSRFLEYLESQDCDIIEFKTEGRNESTVYHAYPGPDDELRAAAAWAKQILITEPDASVGIVVPDLNKRRHAVSAIFDSVLHPDWALRQPGTFQRQYSIAPGRPLSDYPMVHAAIEILSLGYERVPVRRLEFLLRSSFIQGATSEAAMRARFYAALRETGEPAWRLPALLEYVRLHRQYMPVAQGFIKLLTQYRESVKTSPATHTPREWSEVFNQLLKRFGWPGERSLNSIEYQTLKTWREALLELAGMGTVSAKWDYAQAFSNLKDILQAKSFQPETVETPIQVSGLPGISGMAFDFVRVTGMHDLIWPGPAIANPFIPLALQQQAGVPGSSAKQVMEQCKQEIGTLVQSARHVVFSYARQEGDREYRPSPVLRQYLADTPGENGVPDYHRQVFQSRDMEAFSDITAPAFTDNNQASGGTGILSDQSACPFRAFAHHRLKAQGLGSVDIGLDPATRGSLVHEVMHEVWKRIASWENLREMTGNKLESLINSVAAGAIRNQARLKPETFTPEFRRLETRRLVALVMQWMEIDKRRPEFRVSDLEKRHETSFHGLNLRMRIDRVDELPDGGLVIIDYKTGDVSVNKWEGERPEEPQLPLYAVTLEGDVKAVAFACLKKGRLKYHWLGERSDILDEMEDAVTVEGFWQNHLDEWEAVLGKLAEEYLQGHASVTPTKTACRYCDLHSLCRIHERELLMSDNTDSGDEE
jgi:probable DNA repair protein